MHMKRTNLVLDEQLLKEAVRILGAKTYSAAVNAALAEVVRREKVMGLREFFGSKLWEGDLSEMRGDRPRRKASRPARKARRLAKPVRK